MKISSVKLTLLSILTLLLVTGCGLMQPTGYNRQSQPADPNQALLQILQQKTLERTVGAWEEGNKCQPYLKTIQVQQVQINKMLGLLSKGGSPPGKEKEVIEYNVPPVETIPDYPSINFEYGEVENNS